MQERRKVVALDVVMLRLLYLRHKSHKITNKISIHHSKY